jgi:hypothetical protein
MPRNSSGNYTLPAGNPVVPNTLIETTWANPTMSDLGSALTDSLDRFGRGGMLAVLKLVDGTGVQPALSFNSESTMGLYRTGAASLGVSVSGALVAAFTAAGLAVTGAISATGAITAASISAPSLAIAGNATIGGTLGVTGLTSLVNAAISGTLGVTGLLTSVTHTNTGAATVGGTFGVTGLTSLVDLTTTGNTTLGNAVGDTLNVAAGTLQVDATGRVFLGPTLGVRRFNINAVNPDMTLKSSVASGGAGSSSYYFGNSASDTVGFLNYDHSVNAMTFGVNGTEKVRLDTSGNLGIAGASGGARLQVAGGTTIATLTDWNTKANAQFNLANPGVRFGIGYTVADQVELQAYDSGNASRDIILQRLGGKLGIAGTPSGASKVQVLTSTAGNDGIAINNSGSSLTALFMVVNGATGGVASWANAGVIEAQPSAGAVGLVLSSFGSATVFQTGARAEGMRLDSSGNLGIGGAPTTGALEIIRGAAANAEIALRGNANTYALAFSVNQNTTSQAVLFNRANADMIFGTNSTTKLTLTADGRLYGSALHNNAGSLTGPTNQYIASGSDTPTLTAVTNVAGSANNANSEKYIRVGNVVHCVTNFTVTATAAAGTATVLGMSIPIASNLPTGANNGSLTGVASMIDSVTGAYVLGTVLYDGTNDRAQLTSNAATTNSYSVRAIFSYEVF